MYVYACLLIIIINDSKTHDHVAFISRVVNSVNVIKTFLLETLFLKY